MKGSNTKWDWDPDPATQKQFRPITKTQLHQLGIKTTTLTKVSTLEELRKDPPNLVVGTCIKYVRFVQNQFKSQELFKRERYVMALSVYQQLHYVPESGVKILKPANIKFKNLYKPYFGESLDDQTLLVSRTGGIGDLLFTQPNLVYLKEKYPSCTILFACGPQYQSMVETWDCIDKVLDLPFPVSSLTRSDFHAIFEGVIERTREAENSNAYNLFSRWLGLDLPDELLQPKQTAKPERVEECREILKKWNLNDKPFLIAQLRASSPIRTPRPSFWLEILNKLTEKGYNILLTDSPRQSDNVDKFISQLNEPDKVFNFCKHSTSVDFTIAITFLSKLAISTDSALIHLAQSLDVPGFGIYGPFPAFIRLKTYKNCDWVEGKCPEGPCFVHGHQPCSRNVGGYSTCYDNINIDEAVEKIDKILEK